MRGSSNFHLRGGGGGGGGGGGAGQNLTGKKAFSTFWSSNLSTVASTSSTCLQLVQLSISKKTVLFGSKGGPTFSRGEGRTQLLIPYRTCDFQGEFGSHVPPPQPSLWVRP